MDRRDDRSFASSRGMQPLRVLEGGTMSSARASTAAAVDHPVAASDAARELAPEVTPDVTPDVTVGRYGVYAEIASGGMATIHIGRLLGPVGFARTVAIKRLHPQFAKDPEFVAMFLDEARLTARIRHPNVVSTLDVVATEGELFVVMDYVAGESLARLLRIVRGRKEAVPIPIAAAIMVDVLHGLHAAHEARDERGELLNIVHRDVSPHNILVGTDGAAHLIDFGIAKARGRAQVTRDGEIKGKLSYMPPEQLLGQPLDHRADVFAASIVLWEALTGRRLFQGTDDGDILAKVLLGQVDKPSLYARGLGREADQIVLRGLARERDDRYPTAREMALAIEAAMPLAPPSQVGTWVEAVAGEELVERTMQIASVEGGVPVSAAASSRVKAISVPPEGTHRRSTHSRRTQTEAAMPAHGLGYSAPPPRLEPTQPTVQLGLRARTGSGTTSARLTSGLAADDSLAAVSGIPGSGRRSAVLAASVVLMAAIGAVGFVRVHAHHVAAVGPSVGVPQVMQGLVVPNVNATSPSASAVTAANAGGWVPVPQAPAVPEEVSPEQIPPAAPAAAGKPPAVRKARPLPVARPVRAAPPPPDAVPAPAPAASENPSCDPPYWIDPDGNKRYYRHCAGR
ncbi:MAG TPA: serine/threonine-protein kinase [Polyangiaceae bacterium]|nr:serine/threonine-protein kinase [Polyangiaceae bacterium]